MPQRMLLVLLALVLTAHSAFAEETATPAAAKVDKKKGGEVVAAAPESSSGYGKPTGLLGPITIGPKLTIGSLPVPAGFGIEAKFMNWVGASLDYYYIPTVTLSSVGIGLQAFSATARLFPFQGSFFLGTSLGSRSFTGSKTENVAGIGASTVTVDVTTLFVGPHLGWRWVAKTGFFMGMEFGWQFAMSNSTTTAITPAAAALAAGFSGTKAEVEEQADDLGKAGLPQIALLQIGYLF
jgi:hypothetical protein